MNAKDDFIYKLDKLLDALKATPRTGWMLRGVHSSIAESIAEHMNESSLIALVLGSRLRERGIEIDAFHASAIAAVHDIAEALIGDLVKTVTNIIGRDRKESMEVETLERYFGKRNIVLDLVKEYTGQATLESRLAKLSEELATLLQGLRYRRIGYRVDEIVCSMYNSIEELLVEDSRLALLAQYLSGVLKQADMLCGANSGEIGQENERK